MDGHLGTGAQPEFLERPAERHLQRTEYRTMSQAVCVGVPGESITICTYWL